MTNMKLAAGSAKELASCVANLETKNKQTINAALVALGVELEENQRLIYEAFLSYRDALQSPSEDDFYDLIDFIGNFTVDFNENRIDIRMIAEESLRSWANRQGAPKESVRRSMMVFFIEAAIAGGMLSGVGRVKDYLSFARDDDIPGAWLLVGDNPKLRASFQQEQYPWETTLAEIPWFEELPTRVRNACKDNEWVTLGQLLMQTNSDFKRLPNVGPVSYSQLRTFLQDRGYELGSVSPEQYEAYMQARNKSL
jgi:hypothetical protein